MMLFLRMQHPSADMDYSHNYRTFILHFLMHELYIRRHITKDPIDYYVGTAALPFQLSTVRGSVTKISKFIRIPKECSTVLFKNRFHLSALEANFATNCRK